MAAGMLHTDFRERLVLDTGAIPWVASPEPGVWRRMLERADAESGRATSIVRYEPGARFHAHRHPMGEDFFVLEGTFSDEHGNYTAGSYAATCSTRPTRDMRRGRATDVCCSSGSVSTPGRAANE